MLSIGKKLAILLIMLLFLLNAHIIYAVNNDKIYGAPELTATETTNTQITLKWTAPQDYLKYNIYRAYEDSSDFSLIGTVFTPFFTDTGLDAEVSYKYYVRAFASENAYGDSNVLNAKAGDNKIVLGFTTKYGDKDVSSYKSLANNSDVIDEIGTYTYITDAKGNLTIAGTIPSDQVSYAKSKNINTYALITNEFDGKLGKELLESPQNRQNLISNILSELKKYEYTGVNIDFEILYASSREHFSAFMKELYETLKPQGFAVTVDVPAKTMDVSYQTWIWAYDYSEIAKYSDRVIIMTYDEHYPGGEPGPVASINWVKNVIDYAVTVIPNQKILLGVAAYGYVWSSNGTKAYGIETLTDMAASYGKDIQWDPISCSPYFSFTDKSGIYHTVWFENNDSFEYKLDIVNDKKLGGIAIWKLGLENPSYWTSIRNKLK
ncbi:putative sporulation-specific glycosylase YdhD [Oxobacter pfennigii]|uniref:Putative sporulation-specific glycosylase YdhD n=1 Tax=Oxobacter pfennigii TaxID=36849 RepID=A0A0P9AJ51_9CLOT|nr:glycosyl hydrolase family 18 protein [Oxobacter pfennigii]KPU45463.1 putative sporulation-specific glycosylase YdhD [Oxobacter pfennigii]